MSEMICLCTRSIANPLCPVHGDVRDTSINVIPFPLPASRNPRTVTVTVLVDDGRDAVAVAELVADALDMVGLRYVGAIQVDHSPRRA